MSRVVVTGADEDLQQRVSAAVDGDVFALAPGRLPADPARLFELLADGELPEVLLLGPLAPADEVLNLAGRLDVQCPGISVVLVAEPRTLAVVRGFVALIAVRCWWIKELKALEWT